ncbi:Bloom syndrome protein homolog isoform X2 [Vanessa cardui]|uniref:Bloom syndrome protein homolog isoform X2 n=1 Tax=Vanessa cardui TaxID=171605 RepID=UPI001F13A21A|nr:Bloom syndrome protein homolog isoform X2 [Vanessa cardui]
MDTRHSTPVSEGNQSILKKPKFVWKSKTSDSTSTPPSSKTNHSILLKNVCQRDKGMNSGMNVDITSKEIEDCKILYIQLLEKISEAFRRLSDLTKDVLHEYNDETYKSVNKIEVKLKSIIQSQGQHNEYENNNSNVNSIILQRQNSSTFCISDDESLQALRLSEGIADECKSSTSSPFSEYQTSIKSKVIGKRSLSLNSNSSHNDSTLNIYSNQSEAETTGTKKKFVVKRPSSVALKELSEKSISSIPSNTLERVKNASERLQPVQAEGPAKCSFVPASSVPFQPPELSKSLSCFPSSDAESSINRNTSFETDFDDETNVISLNDSTPNRSNNDESGRNILIDDDGWQVYDPNMFGEENNIDSNEHAANQSQDNLMDQNENDHDAVYEGMGEFHPGTINDGITGEFDGFNYPHSDLMMQKLREKFGLRSFRPNQLQVINAALLGHDCFVLMPTGGGKSLCYQLPAILTPGLTVVVSPLRSLILDQVNKLNSLDISAAYFSGEQSAAEANEIYYQLSLAEPTIRLLYVTPEKLSSSEKFQNTLSMLYSRDLIARFVVDEAHCVSTWGHDFRKDYKRLGELRRRFPRVRLMALTATATPRVRTDILHQLKVTNCKWFLCSFNRPNLSYEVLEKTPKDVNKDIIKVIRQRFSGLSGIVYCLWRKECEALALELRKAGLQAAAYHAGLQPRAREDVQAGWLADRYTVICATIAFGMGIDKADVRFVIHHSMPKSVEGYYQEAGRAGRDGEPAACLLYYNYCDVTRIRRMQEKERSTTKEARQVHLDNLMLMAQMCENVSECRRVQVLAYLGEHFPRERCVRGRAPCDTCRRAARRAPVDVTRDCVTVARAVRDLRRPYTLLQLADALRGSMQQRVAQLQGNPLHGLCKTWARGDAQRLLRQLLFKKVLRERIEINNDISNAYITAGPELDRLLSGEMKIEFDKQPQSQPTAAAAAPARAASDAASAGITARLETLKNRCYADLVEACRQMAQERGATLTTLFPQASLRAMAKSLPETAEAMLALPHVTRANYDKYGHRLLRITSDYSVEKLGILMDYQDELEMHSAEKSTSNPTWSPKAKAKPRRARKTGARKGGVQKRTKREGSTLTKTKAALNTSRARKQTRERVARAVPVAGGSRLGAMPMPRANAATARPGVLPSRLNFM